MAFLRSAAQCYKKFAIFRNCSSLPPPFRSFSIHRRDHGQTTLTNTKVSRAEILACKQYYVDLKRELNVNGNEAKMSTLAAHKVDSTATSASIPDPNRLPPQRDPLDLSFNDPVAAFKSKTTWELLRAYFVYVMCSSEYLVENNIKVNNESADIFSERKMISDHCVHCILISSCEFFINAHCNVFFLLFCLLLFGCLL